MIAAIAPNTAASTKTRAVPIAKAAIRMIRSGGGPANAQNGMISAAAICVACATHITVRRL